MERRRERRTSVGHHRTAGRQAASPVQVGGTPVLGDRLVTAERAGAIAKGGLGSLAPSRS